MKKTTKLILVALLGVVFTLSACAFVACKVTVDPKLDVTVSSSADVRVGDSLDSVKQYLTVKYTDSGNKTTSVTNYELQGALTEGQTTLTVNYKGLSKTCTITVKANDQQGGDNPVKPTVTVNANGGTVGDFTVNDNGTLTPPTTQPIRNGYIFDGYFKDAECTIAWDFDTDKVTVDITVTIYIRWKPEGGDTPITKPTVTVNANGGTFNGSITVNDDNKVTEPLITPTRPNYKFDGWYKDEDCTIKWNFETDTVTVNVTIYVKWIRVYDVTFESNGGSAISPIEVDENTTITKPTDPNKDNYIFDGWYKDEDRTIPWNFETNVVTTNITLYAKWLSFFNVTFNSNGGSEIDGFTNIKENDKIYEPASPTKNGYIFGGWYKDSALQNLWDFSVDSVADDTILYAKWIAVFTVTFESNGGSAVEPLYEVESGATITEPTNPTKEDFLFECWCIDARLQNIWNFDTNIVTQDIKLYARWRDPVGGTSGLSYVYNYQDNTYHLTGRGFATDSQIRIPSLYQGLPVSVIRYDAFLNSSDITSVIIPKSVKTIGDSAFSGCTNLFDVTINEGVWYIGGSAFKNCASLTDINIPSSVSSIGKGAFSGCGSLQSITLSSISAFSPYPFGYIFGETSYTNGEATDQRYDDYNGNTQYPTYYIPASLKNITITKGNIPDETFFKCSNIENVEIPCNATTIGESAFNRCSNLKSVNIPEGVTTIGKWAFNNCSSLTSITLPDSITSIGEAAFYSCKNLTSLKIPEKVTIINDSLLRYCNELTSVTIGKNITYISSYAFSSSPKLTYINFEGTVEEWDKIQKSYYWKSLASLKKVICSDGEVAL